VNIRRPLHSEMEEVIVAHDEITGFHAVIAIHSTLLGPAVCGTRFRHYHNEQEALEDATKTAPQATNRAALANIPFGGASAAVFCRAGEEDKRAQFFRSFGKLIDTLEGQVIATEDLGCNMEDVNNIKNSTPFCCGGSNGGPGDSAYFTALGVLRSIEACVRHVYKTNSLQDVKVAVLGVGRVGFQLCEMLHIAGVKLYVADIFSEHVQRAQEELGAKVIRPREIIEQKVDVISPCAIGSLLDDSTIPRLNCKIIAGSSNNQLVKPYRHARMIHNRELIYAPDFAVNAGALYTNACEIDNHDASYSTILVNGIHDTIDRILQNSDKENIPTYDIAMKMVKDKLRRYKARKITQYL